MVLADFRLKKAVSEYDSSKQDSERLLSGILGLNNNVVQVSNREGFVYVRLRDNQNEVIEAYNGAVSPIFNLPVVIRWNKTRYEIVGRDLERYVSWGTTSAYLPLHGQTHSFGEQIGGGDVVWVFSRQFMPWLISPSGSSAAGNGIVQGYPYYFDGGWKYLATTGTPSLVGNPPTGAANARMSLVYLNQRKNIIEVTASDTEFPASITGTAEVLAYTPPVGAEYYIPLAAVRLVTGTTKIGWQNLYDVRPIFTTPPTGTTGGGGANFEGFTDGSVIFVEDEGAQEDNANFFYDDTDDVLILGDNDSGNVQSATTVFSIQGDAVAAGQELICAGSVIPYIGLGRANGTFASPTAIQLGDIMYRLYSFGYDGSAYVNKARVDHIATENWSTNARGTKMQFRTTPTGTADTAAAVEVIGTGLSVLKGLKTGQVVSVSDTYAMDGEDCVVLATLSGSDYAISLPPATNASQIVYLKCAVEDGESVVVYHGRGIDSIDGAASGTFQNLYEYVILIADGSTTWYKFSG